MRKGNKKRMNSKTLALVLALMMLVGGVVGGTVAWLTAKTQTVTNTFTTSDVDIELKEHTYDPATDSLENGTTTEGVDDYKMVPGWTIPKDPWVTVKAGSEDCFVFIKVETPTFVGKKGKEYQFDDFIKYAIDTEDVWTELDGVAGVYYCEAKDITEDLDISILAGGSYTFNNVDYTWDADEVLTKPEVTKEMMNDLGNALPKLKITAYASQMYKNNNDPFTAAQAWANVQP